MKIWKFKIINVEEFKELKQAKRNWDERELIIKDNDIQKEKEKLEKKYKKYFGKWYLHDDGFIFQIRGIYYNGDRWSYYNKFQFDCYVPNWVEGYLEVDIDDVIEGKYQKTKKENLF